MKMPCRFVAALACCVAMTFACIDVHAEDLWPLEQRFNLGLGVFVVDTDTTMRVDGEARGTQIDLEDDFGFQSQDRFRVDGYWRFAKRHKVRLMYFGSRATSNRTIDDTIEFRDVTYPVNATVHAEFNTDIVELAYEYSFIRRSNFELAATAGLHNLRIETRLSAQATSNVGAGGIDLASNAEGNGPLPVFGVRAIWALSDHFYFDAQAQFFALEFDNYDGNLQDYKISFVWQPFRNVGVGVGYNDFRTRLDVDDDNFDGRLEFSYGGALGFVTVAF